MWIANCSIASDSGHGCASWQPPVSYHSSVIQDCQTAKNIPKYIYIYIYRQGRRFQGSKNHPWTSSHYALPPDCDVRPIDRPQRHLQHPRAANRPAQKHRKPLPPVPMSERSQTNAPIKDTIHTQHIGPSPIHHLRHPNRAHQFLLATRPGGAISRLPLPGGGIESVASIVIQIALLSVVSFFISLFFCVWFLHKGPR